MDCNNCGGLHICSCGREPPDERRAFIRKAAIALCATHRMRDEIWEMSHSDAKAVWDTAIALWHAKPEDC